MGWRTTVAVLGVLALAVQAGCSDDDGTVEGAGTSGPDEEAGTTTTTGPPRPEGPAAELAGPLTAGRGIDLASPRPVDLEAAGWVEEEYAAAGTATSYRADGDLPFDGTFELEPEATADYRTRVVVRRPVEGADFNGTVVVEWLNVSGGLDAAPDFAYLGDELLRGGYAWVGVSAQRIGIEGGQVAVGVPGASTGGGIKASDPDRYGDLVHPGDAFSYDVFTQVARALREPGAVDALGGLRPERLLAVGESQSGFALTTYVNGVQPLTRAFDGFLVHSRGAAAAPLGQPGEGFDMASTVGRPPAQIRTDGEAPVLVLETETDVLGFLGYFAARQPDDDRFRLWEVAGTAHADQYLIGPLADLLDCGAPINDGPHHLVAKAALRRLDTWVRTGDAPPEAPRLDIDESGAAPAFARDEDGIATGGIRTPHVDVPVATLSGEPGPSGSIVCALMGTTVPLAPERLADRYPDRATYLAEWQTAADAVIDAGFVLPEDRPELLADARPDALPG
jgi:hypothetical protein